MKKFIVYIFFIAAASIFITCENTNTDDTDYHKPDLVDSGSYYEQLIPNPVSYGENFQALCMVGNNSEVDAGSFYIDLYASTDQRFTGTSDYFIARQRVSSMPAESSDVIIIIEPDDFIKFPSIPSGYYYILYVIDSTNSIEESNESNNVGLCTGSTLHVDGEDTTYSIVATAGNGGSISPIGRVFVEEDDDQTFTITPDEGYAISTVWADSIYVGPVSSYTFYNVGSNHTISAFFRASPSLLVRDGCDPHLSPDGLKIAFVRLTSTANNATSDIWTINVDGTNLTHVTNTPNDSEFCPQWTPDGANIGFIKVAGSYSGHTGGTLWEISPNGTNLTQTWSLDVVDSFCFWICDLTPVPSSSWFTVMEYRGDGVTDGLYLGFGWPLSNSALRLAWGTDPTSPNNPTTTNPRIALFNPLIGETCGAYTFIPSDSQSINPPIKVENTGNFPWPCMSPQGSKIIAGADGGEPNGLYVMSLSGDNLTQLTFDGRPDHQATWSGSTVVFVRVPSEGTLYHGDLYKMTLQE
ncbi:MAG: hypothetical protein CVV44_17250 [Spirochaetae bacterium HGW-Spirochaetae-1]|jgi:hypothetical protein|nr:MAG: hypothetical protein CVV44_17250 [Spirochaetae bacterium HGW-Spirochaetae-1]